MDRLLAAFHDFFRQNSEHWGQRARYTEAGPQLVLQAFLHRVVNGRGRIEREYALGRRRVDLLDQTAACMDLSDADAGHLVVFDMREGGRGRRRSTGRSGA